MISFIKSPWIWTSIFLALLLLAVPVAFAAECNLSLLENINTCTGGHQTSTEAPTFVTPAPAEDTLMGRRLYGRLADNANVYAEPKRAAPPVRNVGDGYLFVTIMGWFENDAGETWYEINFNEYVHEDDIILVEPSGFQGVQIKQQPNRPFGWVVQEVTPSREPDGEPDQTLPKLPRYTFVEFFDAVLGQGDWLWYDIGDGRWVKQTHFSIVNVSPRPEGVGESEFWAEVDLYEQTFAAYEGDRMVYATVISSGLNRWPTREGLFQVWSRFGEYKMSGAEGQDDYYFLEDVLYIMYFDELIGRACMVLIGTTYLVTNKVMAV